MDRHKFVLSPLPGNGTCALCGGRYTDLIHIKRPNDPPEEVEQ